MAGEEGYSKKILLTEEEISSKGNLVQIVKNKAQAEIKPNYHEQMIEIYHTLQGNAIVFCGETKVRARPGHTLLYEPGEIHGLVNDADYDIQFVVFRINAKDDDIYWVER